MCVLLSLCTSRGHSSPLPVSPTFPTGHVVDPSWSGAQSGVAIADVDGDGDVDVVASGSLVSWYESDGGSVPAFTQHVLANVTVGSCGAVAVGDLNQARRRTVAG